MKLIRVDYNNKTHVYMTEKEYIYYINKLRHKHHGYLSSFGIKRVTAKFFSKNTSPPF